MSSVGIERDWPADAGRGTAEGAMLDWPDQVRIDETADGVRYVLPGRVLGGGHVFGAAVVVAGIVVLLAGVWWAMAVLLNGPLTWPAHALHLIGPASIAVIGAVLWTTGLYIANGRCELVFHGGPPATLHRLERAGLLRWTTRKPVARLRRLRIDLGITDDKTIDEAITTGVALPLASLVGEYEGGRTERLITAYPVQWLEPIAHDLADRLALHPARQDSTALRPEVVVRDPQKVAREGSDADRPDDPVVQPSESAIEISRSREGLTITIPPLSMWRDRKGAFSLGAMWNGVMAAFTGSAFGFMNTSWYMTLGIAAFWGIGSLVMLFVISLGRRSAIVDVVEERYGRSLLISQRSYFGVKQRGWHRDELRTIECGASGMEVNERPVMELHITPASGGTATFFTGRDEDELRWLARVLREALELNEDRA